MPGRGPAGRARPGMPPGRPASVGPETRRTRRPGAGRRLPARPDEPPKIVAHPRPIATHELREGRTVAGLASQDEDPFVDRIRLVVHARAAGGFCDYIR